ncbi:MAG TPA: type II toxin-antitoxin system HicA family toxin [Candidatus Bathyarchaeia archaeon]|nr:type II toxin-antitoxin system HicA family toxin [Candidatus Bathyarchaeia archaeon]
MTRLPRARASDVINALHKVGFEVARIKGSHHVLVHPDGRTTVIPVHSGEVVGPGLLRQILREAKITPEKLQDLL